MMRRQRGVTIVEFALVGLLVFTVLFGCLEFGRLFYTYNSLTEATRRAARVAAVCPPGDPAVTNVALYLSPAGNDQGIRFPGLTAANISVEYLNAAGGVVGASNANIPQMQYVRVSIVDYAIALNIPLIRPAITFPPFNTTLPTESLGADPGGTGVAPTRRACNTA